jgi:2'-5' RNA ligase
MRLFIAIELPDAVRTAMGKMQERLRPIVPAKWSRREQLHITLKFLGETQDSQIPEIIAVLQEIVIDQPIRLTTSGIVFFPPHGPVRIVGCAMEDEGNRCASLASRIDRACHEVGYKLEGRKWTPHVTIGRVKERTPADIRDQAKVALGRGITPFDFEVSEFSLFESRLDSRGPEYLRLAQFDLYGPGGDGIE